MFLRLGDVYMKKKLFELKKSSFLEGTFIATIAIIITKIMGMLYVIPFYAMVGMQGCALYSYAYNVYIIFLDLSSAGIPIAMSKLIKEYHTLGLLEAKVRTYHLGKRMVQFLSFLSFLMVFFLAPQISFLILGNLEGGNTLEGVTLAIRCVSIAILVIPNLSITKGYLQGHSIINIPSISQVIEQATRILMILLGSFLSIYLFHLRVEQTVAIAITGAFFGGMMALFYIKIKIKSQKEKLFENNLQRDEIDDKTIKKKIVSYAIPFILIDLATSVYNFVDMVLLSRTMTHLGYSATQTEFITSSVSTWTGKIGMIVTSIAMGLIVSLIPNMVEAKTLKKMDEVEKHFNKSLQMILVICIPMVLGISILSRPIWSIFYGREYLELGSSILKISIFTTLFVNLYMVVTSSLQSLDCSKKAYQISCIGYITNAMLDVPLMFFFHTLSMPPFLGAILSSILGYGLSFIKALHTLKKEYHFRYKETIQVLQKVILSSTIMILSLMFLTSHILYYEESKIISVLYIGLMGIIGASIYFFCMYKLGAFPFLNKKKLTLKKVSSS